MKIITYLNTSKEEVEAKEHNIWIGISLGNKYFTEENIKQYIKWGLEHTKDNLLIVVADQIQEINFAVFDKKSPESAYRKALKIGDKIITKLETCLRSIEKDKITIVRWEDITDFDIYKKNLKIVRDFYNSNGDFQNYITQVIKQGLKAKQTKLEKMSKEDWDRLSEYVIREIPFFVNGIEFNNKVYTLIPYPGLAMIDTLFIGLNRKEIFPELASKMIIENKTAILEAYVE